MGEGKPHAKLLGHSLWILNGKSTVPSEGVLRGEEENKRGREREKEEGEGKKEREGQEDRGGGEIGERERARNIEKEWISMDPWMGGMETGSFLLPNFCLGISI